MKTGIINKDTVMLVSGGGRGITAACAIQLARQFKCKFILLGRSAVDVVRPAGFVSGMEDADLKKLLMLEAKENGQAITPREMDSSCRRIQASEEITATIGAIKSAGGDAVYLSADVTDKKSLQQALSQPAAVQFGAISAILHGAGNLADKLIEKKTLEDFQSVYNTKIIGLENILSVLNLEPLSTIVLFSSVVGFYGNAGQSDYAMANDVLNKLAGFLNAKLPQCDVVALDWGPWQSGMVTPVLAKAFERRGIHLIGMDDGTQFLAEQLSQSAYSHPQLIVGSELKRQPVSWEKQPAKAIIRRSLSLKDNPFLLDHVIGGNPVLPATCAAGWIINACLELYPGYQLKYLENYKILKGVVFDHDTPQEFELVVNRTEKSTKNSVHLDIEVLSGFNQKLPRYHYKCSVLLTPEIDSETVEAKSWEQSPAQTFPTGLELYQNGFLFHGPSFQGVKKVLELNDSGCRTLCHLPISNAENQGQFPVRSNNPYFNDVVVQSILVWTQLKMDSPCLPASLETFEYYGNLEFGKTYEVRMKIRSVSDSSIVGDLEVCDEQGNLYQRLIGLCGTISPQLKRLFTPPERVIHGDTL
jgi:NAD(P)-dependent dehydrogenase (short-subunit alcohol dehydrogenase family)